MGYWSDLLCNTECCWNIKLFDTYSDKEITNIKCYQRVKIDWLMYCFIVKRKKNKTKKSVKFQFDFISVCPSNIQHIYMFRETTVQHYIVFYNLIFIQNGFWRNPTHALPPKVSSQWFVDSNPAESSQSMEELQQVFWLQVIKNNRLLQPQLQQ